MQSLEVLRAAKAVGPYTKSSIMLGLGETDEEVGGPGVLRAMAQGSGPSGTCGLFRRLMRAGGHVGPQVDRTY